MAGAFLFGLSATSSFSTYCHLLNFENLEY